MIKFWGLVGLCCFMENVQTAPVDSETPPLSFSDRFEGEIMGIILCAWSNLWSFCSLFVIFFSFFPRENIRRTVVESTTKKLPIDLEHAYDLLEQGYVIESRWENEIIQRSTIGLRSMMHGINAMPCKHRQLADEFLEMIPQSSKVRSFAGALVGSMSLLFCHDQHCDLSEEEN